MHVSGLVFHADSENQVYFFPIKPGFLPLSLSVVRRGSIFTKYGIFLMKSVNHFLA